ncbi:hypothetical protein [Actinoalloteichus caeruleus]|uniref:hypothetical protein n=1 Tax=Actinoalloteichus cyanogriseus TaxID=2893586 RepID=UPI003BB85D30
MGGNADAEPYARDCMPLHAGPTGTSSVGPVVNDGTTSLTVTGVELVRPVDMSLVEGVFVPREQPYNTVPYPPPPDKAGEGWPDRVVAPGAVLGPGEEWWFAVGLRSEGPRAATERIRIDYEDADGRAYYALTGTSVAMREQCIGVEIDWPDW